MKVVVDYWFGSVRFSQDHPLLDGCNVKMLRLEFSPNSLPALRGTSGLVQTAVNNGMEIIGVLMNQNLRNNLSGWETWVYNTVNEFKQNVHVWECWNEPNLDNFWGGNSNPVEYTNHLKRCYPAAKSADPTCFVLGGSIVFFRSQDLDFLRTIYANGGLAYMDALSYHPYCDDKDPTNTTTPNAFTKLKTIVHDQIMRDAGDTHDIWITELGWTVDGVGEANQASYIQKALDLALSWGFVRTYTHYCWHGGTGDKGLVRSNYDMARPAYTTVKNWIATHPDVGFNLNVRSSPVDGIPVTVNGVLMGNTPRSIGVEQGQYVISVPQEIDI